MDQKVPIWLWRHLHAIGLTDNVVDQIMEYVYGGSDNLIVVSADSLHLMEIRAMIVDIIQKRRLAIETYYHTYSGMDDSNESYGCELAHCQFPPGNVCFKVKDVLGYDEDRSVCEECMNRFVEYCEIEPMYNSISKIKWHIN